jgi:hypothetical protein
MITYTIDSKEPPAYITFCINRKLHQKVNIKDKFPEYVLPKHEIMMKYFVDLNSGELVFIENESELLKSLRAPTLRHLTHNGKYYRPAIQSDIDKNEEQYDSGNRRLYKYLDNYYSSYEIFLSEDENVSVHIRKSEDGKDIVLERYIKENEVFHRKECVNLAYTVRELQYCKGETLREKYSELIYKNLEIPILRDSLMSYVNGVFKVKQERYGSYDSDSDFDSD